MFVQVTIIKALDNLNFKTVGFLVLLFVGSLAYGQCVQSASSTADEEIFNVTLGTLNNSSNCATLAPGAGSIQNRYSNYTGVAAPVVTQCQPISFSVTIGTCGGNYGNSVAIYIDFNNDGDWIDAGENVYISASSTTGPHTETGSIIIPSTSNLGNLRMRVVNNETSPAGLSPCTGYTWGETEDYMVNVVAGTPATYSSSAVSQLVSGSVGRCETNRQIIGVTVNLTAGCPLNLTQFLLGAGSSTNLAADVSKIHIYYTGGSNSFAATNEFVVGGTTPTGATNTINGSQALLAGSNFFWITYDLNPAASLGDLIDGACSQITVNGANQVPTTTNPAGSGTVIVCTGPGGISGSTLWFKGDAGTSTTTNNALVSGWSSQAASPAITVSQATASLQPTYRDGSGVGNINRFNYNPYIYTDGTSNRLIQTGNFNVANVTSGVSVFQVIGEDMGIVSMEWYNSTNGNIKCKGDALMYINNANGVSEVNVYNQAGAQTVQAFIQTVKGSPNAVTGNGKFNGVSGGSSGNGWRVATTTGVCIGSNMDNGEFMQGGMGEFVVFPSVLSASQSLQVESYLAIKYGVTLGNPTTVSNYLNTSAIAVWTGLSAYQRNIIGIARDDNSGLYQRQSHQYDDSVRIYKGTLAATNQANSATFAQDNSYVVMGSNAGKLCTTTASLAEMPTGLTNCVLYSRLEREWRVTRTNMAETFSIDIKLNNCGAPGSVNIADLRLLVDDDGNFANGGTQCYYIGDGFGTNFSYSNPTISVLNLNTTHIPNNSTRFITIASVNPVTPLPVELIYFDAKLNNERNVDATWQTNTEINTDRFELYRSQDLVNWEKVGIYPAAGNSTTPLFYAEVDYTPYYGTSYYQLKTIDFNGTSSLSEVRTVSWKTTSDLSVYPNPSADVVTLSCKGLNFNDLQFTTALGQIITPNLLFQGIDQVVIDVSGLAAGMYFIQIKGSHEPSIKLVIK